LATELDDNDCVVTVLWTVLEMGAEAPVMELTITRVVVLGVIPNAAGCPGAVHMPASRTRPIQRCQRIALPLFWLINGRNGQRKEWAETVAPASTVVNDISPR
jgi:hypothetical protein